MTNLIDICIIQTQAKVFEFGNAIVAEPFENAIKDKALHRGQYKSLLQILFYFMKLILFFSCLLFSKIVEK